MTPRSIRRAAERRAKKLALKSAKQQATEPRPSGSGFEDPQFEISPARLAANQANAQLSTGPRTEEGKAKSSLNAVKTALTGQTVLLPSDDAAFYERHCQNYAKDLQPEGPRECALVQSLADTDWRLQRIPRLESSIYALGYREFADQFEDEDPDTRPMMIELHTHLVYEKQLRNLQLQEARLHRRREKDWAELRQLQKERREKEAAALTPKTQEQFGFEFSTANSTAAQARPELLQITPNPVEGPEFTDVSHAA